MENKGKLQRSLIRTFSKKGRRQRTESETSDTYCGCSTISLTLLDENEVMKVLDCVQKDLIEHYKRLSETSEHEKVIQSILNSEDQYLKYLEAILRVKSELDPNKTKLLSKADYQTIFFKTDDLYKINVTFYSELKKALKEDRQIGEIFQKLINNSNTLITFINNYPKAIHTLEKCTKLNSKLNSVISLVKVEDIKSETKSETTNLHLSDLLFKPIIRVQNVYINDVLKVIPENDANKMHRIRPRFSLQKHISRCLIFSICLCSKI